MISRKFATVLSILALFIFLPPAVAAGDMGRVSDQEKAVQGAQAVVGSK